MVNWQGSVNVPFWGFWTSPLNICWKLYPQKLGDVQLGHLPTPDCGSPNLTLPNHEKPMLPIAFGIVWRNCQKKCSPSLTLRRSKNNWQIFQTNIDIFWKHANLPIKSSDLLVPSEVWGFQRPLYFSTQAEAKVSGGTVDRQQAGLQFFFKILLEVEGKTSIKNTMLIG